MYITWTKSILHLYDNDVLYIYENYAQIFFNLFSFFFYIIHILDLYLYVNSRSNSIIFLVQTMSAYLSTYKQHINGKL